MLRRISAALVSLVVGLVGAVVFTQPASAVSTLFSDDFTGATGSKPNAAKWSEWSACTYNGSAAYGKIGCGERATLDGQGHLSIPATPNLGTSISTKGKVALSTGKFEARMKIASTPGYWPAFWMLNSDPVTGNARTSAKTVGEVDALEAYTGLLPTKYHRAVHNYYTPDQSRSWSGADDPLCGENIYDSWHTYSATVTANTVTFAFDGVQCGAPVLRSEQAGKPWAFNPDNPSGLWLILTNAVGGAGGQQDPGTGHEAVSPSTLLVDWVKVTR